MSQKQTVTVNGRLYDAKTGLPIDSDSHTTRASLRGKASHTPNAAAAETQPAAPSRHATQAQHIHRHTQKSQTLNRKFTKKPAQKSTPKAAATSATQHHIAPTHGKRLDGIARTKHVAAKPSLAPTKKAVTLQPVAHPPTPLRAQHTPTDIPAVAHPLVQRAHDVQAAKKAPAQQALPSASTLKQAAIHEAMSQAPKHHAKQHSHPSHKRRLSGIVFGCLALVLFGGYLTYLNVPNISVRVAAAQAGIDASYPGYQPDGYRLNGPVAYSDGQVQMQFAANTGTSDFTLKQSKSNWNSSALLENYVKDKSKNEYSTSQEKGITLYTYGSNAAWVSGGILYTIDGNAPLSPDQIRKIATSV